MKSVKAGKIGAVTAGSPSAFISGHHGGVSLAPSAIAC
jgi:hypothetical protein